MANRKFARVPQGLLGLATVLWLSSLVMPAVEVSGGPVFSGYDVLIQGWSAWRNGVFAWFANPLLVICVLAAWRNYGGFSLFCALCGAILAVSSFWSAEIAEAGGMAVPELSFRIGFYCWIAAHLAALGGATTELVMRHFGART